MKKLPRDIIILQMCTINDNHMMYCSWDMERDQHNFFIHHNPSPNNSDYQNLEKWIKIPGDIIILYMCIINKNHMMHGWNTEFDK